LLIVIIIRRPNRPSRASLVGQQILSSVVAPALSGAPRLALGLAAAQPELPGPRRGFEPGHLRPSAETWRAGAAARTPRAADHHRPRPVDRPLPPQRSGNRLPPGTGATDRG